MVALFALAACRPVGPPPSVLLVTVDTLRADRVGAYGARQVRTPALDGLAARGVLFVERWPPPPHPALALHDPLRPGASPARRPRQRQLRLPAVARHARHASRRARPRHRRLRGRLRPRPPLRAGARVPGLRRPDRASLGRDERARVGTPRRGGDGRPQEALAALAEALRLDPNNAQAWNNQGNVLRALGRRTEAAAAYRRAAELAPSYVDPLNGLGVLAVEAKDLDAAAGFFERVLAVDPRYGEARLNLAVVQASRGRTPAARALVEELLRQETEPALVLRARSFLQTLPPS